MNTKPILFSTEMVQAILEGRKTQTRRIVKNKYCNTDLVKANNILYERQNDIPAPYKSEDGKTIRRIRIHEECIPQYQKGDILYVRETWAENILNDKFIYKADEQQGDEIIRGKWKPSIHMPKKAARIFLEVTDVRCERLQDISEEDAIAEGIEHIGPFGEYKGSPHPDVKGIYRAYGQANRAFQDIWSDIFGKQSWDDNPFVWVYEFKRIEKPKEFNQ